MDIVDRHGGLLLKAGTILSDRALSLIVGRGVLWSDSEAGAAENSDSLLPAGSVKSDKPVAALYLEFCEQLDWICRDLIHRPDVTGFEKVLHDLAERIHQTYLRHPSQLVAQILHAEVAQRFSVRQQINCCILVAAMSLVSGKSTQFRKVCQVAALSMNISMMDVQDKLEQLPVAIPDAVAELLRTHPKRSAMVLKGLGVEDFDWIETVLQHHERYDGSGYPFGLKAGRIRAEAGYLYVADLLVARLRTAAKRSDKDPKAVIKQLYDTDRASLEPNALLAATSVLGVYPPGSFVRLLNGEIAAVTSTRGNQLTPKVLSLLTGTGKPISPPVWRDTAASEFAINAPLPLGVYGLKIIPESAWSGEMC